MVQTLRFCFTVNVMFFIMIDVQVQVYIPDYTIVFTLTKVNRDTNNVISHEIQVFSKCYMRYLVAACHCA